MDSDTKNSLDSLKEIILTKFEELEKRLSMSAETFDFRLENLLMKEREQDEKICRLQTMIDDLKNAPNEAKVSYLRKGIDSFIQWIIPFCMAGILLWAQNGFKTKGY